MTQPDTLPPAPGGRATPIDPGQLARDLAALVGPDAVLHRTYDLRLYAYDGSIAVHLPEAVVFPTTTAQVAAIVRYCNRERLCFTARGAGTGLSGGAIPVRGGVLVAFTRMNRILAIDPENRRAVVQPGVVNLHLSQATAAHGLYYVPDPSSQKACTIGGNVGENSGGPHTLLYGVTTNHVLGLEVVTPDGEIRRFGGAGAPDGPGYDLCGLFVGSEGTLGLVTEVTVRLTPLPPGVRTFLAVYDDIPTCSDAVSAIIAAGIVPAALELMDNLTIRAVEASLHAGYPIDAAAVLLIEIEGFPQALDEQGAAIERICRGSGARVFQAARDAAERDLLWKGRKGALGAMGQMTPDYYVCDGVVPRSTLPAVLARVAELSAEYGLLVANVFHAGDGNLHPLVLFDSHRPGATETAVRLGTAIIEVCAAAGGSLSGEHGIGTEKRDMMCFVFNEGELAVMRRVRAAFDTQGLANPAKVLPTPGRCGETRILPPGGAQEHYVREGVGQAW
ncbi:MAG TPA: FAD-linked oxidase C-terminal domain-containing protein [Chloroflexia bacterium]|nr:FAD-linked oxidase C-terminal domain-containing protein [Chloroflexia bacterium]